MNIFFVRAFLCANFACFMVVGKAHADVLQAGIELNTALPPLNQAMAPGNMFDQEKIEKSLEKPVSVDVWYRVPAWAAGSWHHNKATLTSSKSESSEDYSHELFEYVCKGDFDFGEIKDRQGQIWRVIDRGYWTETEYEKAVGHSYIISSELLFASEDKIVIKYRSTIFRVSKETGAISSTLQRESVETYLEGANQTMRQREWHRNFDWLGKPEDYATNENFCTRTGPFLENLSGKVASGSTYAESFERFLKKNGLQNLSRSAGDDFDAILNGVQPGKKARAARRTK